MQVKMNEFGNAISAVESRINDLRDQVLSDNLPPESVAQNVRKVQEQLMECRQALQDIMHSLQNPSELPSNSPGPPQLSQTVASQPNPTQYAAPTPSPALNHFRTRWVPKHPIKEHLLQLEGRDIDLWALHAEVLGMNGYQCFVQPPDASQPAQILCNLSLSPDQWAVLTAWLGFVYIPGDAGEPARSRPGAAVHVEHVYKQCLQGFDSEMVLGQQTATGAESGGSSMGPQGFSGIKDPKAISEIINYTNLSIQDLQARGVQPHIIALVEKHRDQLKSTLETQRMFALGIQNTTPQGQPCNVSNPRAMNSVDPMFHPQGATETMEDPNSPDAISEIINNFANFSVEQPPPMQPGSPAQPMNVPNGQLQQRQIGGALIPIAPIGRPTQAQTTDAIELVRRLKDENKHVGFPNARPLYIPDAQRLEYNVQFERLHRLVTALDQKLPHFAVCIKEEVIKKLVVIIHAVQQQRDALASNPTQYYMPLTWVVAMINQITQVDQVFHQWVNNAMRAAHWQLADANQQCAGADAASQPGSWNL
ncbi:hypothetical protein V8D89_007899 [Ganoderma adspersum]